MSPENQKRARYQDVDVEELDLAEDAEGLAKLREATSKDHDSLLLSSFQLNDLS